MLEKELNDRLLAKMDYEQDRFLTCMLQTEPIRGMVMSKRYHIQDAILDVLQRNPLSSKQAAALLCSDTPLADVYFQWVEMWGDQEKLLHQAIADCADIHIQNLSKAEPDKGGDSA